MCMFNIYFDNASTAPPLDMGELMKACAVTDGRFPNSLSSVEGRAFGNPSSPHGLGIQAERAINSARAETAAILGCENSEIIFTSGGTESNNLAIIGFALANKRQGIDIFAEPWEHPSVLEPIKFAREMGYANLHDGARLVCLSHVNHETGDIQNISEIASNLKNEKTKTIIFVDGVQAFCKENLNLKNIDMYSFSGHKFHAGHGAGGLFVRKGIRLVPLLHGGGQEFSIRAGTENVNAITRMAETAKFLHSLQTKSHAKTSAIKSELAKLTKLLPDCFINSRDDPSPYILNLSFLGIKGETLVHALSEKGVYVSMGAACSTRKKQKSTLESMGFSANRAESAVRFSFSILNTREEAVIAKNLVLETVGQLRAMNVENERILK